jgi:hypothetical protein
MTDRQIEATRLDQMAAQESGLARSQMLAAEADRLRRLDRVKHFLGSYAMPLLRN